MVGGGGGGGGDGTTGNNSKQPASTLHFLLLKQNIINELSDESILQFSSIQTLDLRLNPFIEHLQLNDVNKLNMLKKIDNFLIIDESNDNQSK